MRTEVGTKNGKTYRYYRPQRSSNLLEIFNTANINVPSFHALKPTIDLSVPKFENHSMPQK
jgi:hypothetical protein